METSTSNNQPTINLNLYVTLSSYRPEDQGKYPIRLGISIYELVRQLLIPASMGVSVFVNGDTVAMDYQLHGEEEVKIFPLMGGGNANILFL